MTAIAVLLSLLATSTLADASHQGQASRQPSGDEEFLGNREFAGGGLIDLNFQDAASGSNSMLEIKPMRGKKYTPATVKAKCKELQGPRGSVKIYHNRQVAEVGPTKEFAAWILPCQRSSKVETEGACDVPGQREYYE